MFILLGLTAVLCLILGMGLPTTANYIVVASLLAGVLVELGTAAGLVLPLIAVHLYVFYFGILADDTPPVCLAAFAAAAISRADPIKTGIQGFFYDIRTAILPFIFIFNPELLLIGVTSFWHGALVFCMALLAMFAFSSLVQRWFVVKTTLFESLLLVAAVVGLFRPDYVIDKIHPAYAPIGIGAFTAGEIALAPGERLRLHVVRETNYGDRYKLYVLETPPDPDTPPSYGPDLGPYGIELTPEADGRYSVADLTPGGVAETVGVFFGDYVTEVDVAQPGQPPKELVYPAALALLGLFVALQLTRRRRQAA